MLERQREGHRQGHGVLVPACLHAFVGASGVVDVAEAHAFGPARGVVVVYDMSDVDGKGSTDAIIDLVGCPNQPCAWHLKSDWHWGVVGVLHAAVKDFSLT